MADSNPGNFANWDKDDLKKTAAKGGHASHGGTGATQEESGGTQQSGTQSSGQHNPGQFEKGSEKAREAGRKGGLASGGSST